MAVQDALIAIAQSCMSFPVRTVEVTASVEEASKILSRYGHTGLCVVEQSALVGIVTRRDLGVATRYGLGHAAISVCMSAPVKTVTPKTPLLHLQALMTTYDIGRLPVMSGSALVGIVTRSDVLRQLQRSQLPNSTVLQSADLSADSAYPAPSDLYTQLQQRLLSICPEVWPALRLLSTVSDSEGWALYLVGGGVRDLLLACANATAAQAGQLTDLDLVVAGAAPGAGVRLAEEIQSRYPQVKTQIYGQFQTAALSWPETVEASSFTIDIATARTEFYPYPAANPEVTSSTIHQDLYRRDFTVNAMALRVNGDSPGQLLDFFGGWIDLQRRSLKVIHPNSFVEDPTRIFRAVRFALRLGFELAPHTQQLVQGAIASGLYAQLQASHRKIPALQSRLKAELKYLLSTDQWAAALRQLDELGALACIDDTLSLSPELWKQLRRMGRWQPRFLPHEPRWQLMVTLMIAWLKPKKRGPVAARLQLDSHVQQRISAMHAQEAQLVQQLTHCHRPSQVYQQLQSYEQVELLLTVARHPYTLGPQVWQYIVQLSRMPQLINGATLKRLGYRPGPQFREMLTTVHQLTLDGELTDAKAAENYVLAHYSPEAAQDQV
ncbi:MAG: CBS domain-containing protein [Cyanobacteria bacterium J06588_5]